MSLCLSLCDSNNQALQIALLFAVHKLLRFRRGPCQERWIRASFCPHPCKRVLTVQQIVPDPLHGSLTGKLSILTTSKTNWLFLAPKKKIHSHHPLCARRSYKLQKYLRHCTLFWLKCPGHKIVPVIALLLSSKLSAIQDNAHN